MGYIQTQALETANPNMTSIFERENNEHSIFELRNKQECSRKKGNEKRHKTRFKKQYGIH